MGGPTLNPSQRSKSAFADLSNPTPKAIVRFLQKALRDAPGEEGLNTRWDWKRAREATVSVQTECGPSSLRALVIPGTNGRAPLNILMQEPSGVRAVADATTDPRSGQIYIPIRTLLRARDDVIFIQETLSHEVEHSDRASSELEAYHSSRMRSAIYAGRRPMQREEEMTHILRHHPLELYIESAKRLSQVDTRYSFLELLPGGKHYEDFVERAYKERVKSTSSRTDLSSAEFANELQRAAQWREKMRSLNMRDIVTALDPKMVQVATDGSISSHRAAIGFAEVTQLALSDMFRRLVGGSTESPCGGTLESLGLKPRTAAALEVVAGLQRAFEAEFLRQEMKRSGRTAFELKEYLKVDPVVRRQQAEYVVPRLQAALTALRAELGQPAIP